MNASPHPLRIRLILATVAVVATALVVSVSRANAADAQGWCSAGYSLSASGGVVNAVWQQSCVGPLGLMINLKRNGVVVYSITESSTWGGYTNPSGIMEGYNVYWSKSFGQTGCVRGATYQLVVSYATSLPYVYPYYTNTFTSGTPRVLC